MDKPILVKVAYVYKGVECVDTLQCRIFTVHALADAWEQKALDTTGCSIDVNVLGTPYYLGDEGVDEALTFVFDIDGDVVGGYATPIQNKG